MIGLKPVIVRPNVRVSAKKNDFVAPTEAPGEGKRRFPSMDEPEKKPHPIKKKKGLKRTLHRHKNRTNRI